MLLQPRHLCFLLHAVSMVVGLSEALNPSSLPSPSTTTLKLATTFDYGFDATTSSLVFNGFSTTPVSLALNSTVPASKLLKALTVDDSSIAKNVDGNVNIYGSGSINVTLNNGQLTFGYCVDDSCEGKVLVCYDSDTVISTSDDNPRKLCGSSGQCGFQIEMNAKSVLPMGEKRETLKKIWIKNEGKCSTITMVEPEITLGQQFKSCAPKVVNGVVTLNIKSMIPDCPLKIVGAKLKPPEVSTTPGTTHKDSTTEDSSSATTIWIVVACLIFAFALLGLVIFAVWFFKLRHRKAKPAKNDPEAAIINGSPIKKALPQMQVKDEVKNDSVAVGPKLPTKSESKVVAAPPKSESKVAPETPAKPKIDEPAKLKTEEAPQDKLKTAEDTAAVSTVLDKVAQPPIDPAGRNEKLQARAKTAFTSFRVRSVLSTKSVKGKKDSALLRLQASNEYRRLEPIHSLNKVHEIYPRSANHNARLYPPGKRYSDGWVKALLLDPVATALEAFHQLSADARKILVEHGVEFDFNDNTTKVSLEARRMVRNDETKEHIKAYLFLAEYGKDFDPTPAILPKYSAPLLFVVAMGTRYSDQLREAAIIEMRRHLPIIRKCWSNEERRWCHFPINGIEQAYRLNKRAFRRNADLDSRSSS